MGRGLPPRRFGGAAVDGRYARVVDQLTLHGAAVDFRELCRRAFPAGARYLVLDLDRTIHLGRNIGELVGWEYCSLKSYGAKYPPRSDEGRNAGRFFLDTRRPLATARYLALGARLWAYPGLFYFFWAKLAAKVPAQRRAAFLRFGPEPIQEIQEVPQTTLLQQLATLPIDTVHELVRAVWRRQAPDMVITREDLSWLRERCPGLTIILSSASPAVVLETAAAELGVDAFFGTEVERHEGRLCAPLLRGLPVMLAPGRPHRLSSPGKYRLNVSYEKIRHLLERYPDLFDDGVTSVGISDNGYGEDGAFAEYFTHVIDVNSKTPFPPIVGAASPCREVHSAAVLTQEELERRRAEHPGWTDPRRREAPEGAPRTFTRQALEPLLREALAQVERAAQRLNTAEREVAHARAEAQAPVREQQARLEETVAAYNAAEAAARSAVFERLEDQLTTLGELRAAVAKAVRPLSQAAYELERRLDEARQLVSPGSLARS
jgi:hypothetical protein